MSKGRVVIVQNSVKTVLIFRENYLVELKNNNDIIIIAPNDDYDSKVKLSSLGMEVKVIPPLNNKLNILKAIFLINLHILNERRKGGAKFVVHFLVTTIFSYFSLIPFNKNVIIYVEGLGSLVSKSSFYQRLLKLIITKNNAKRLFCNESERELIGLPCDIVTHGIGIDINKFERKSKINKDYKDFKILFVGRLLVDKGILDAVKVVEELLLIRKDITFHVVGDYYKNNPSSITEKQICEIKKRLSGHVIFHGFQSNMHSLYASSDLLLLPSVREGFPVCVMEASISGIPSFGYKVPGMMDAIVSNVNGFLVDFKDIKKLVKVVNYSLDHKVLNKYVDSCYNHAISNFDVNHKSKSLMNHIASI